MKSPINLVILSPGFAADDNDSTAIPSLQLFISNLTSNYPEINVQIVSFHYPSFGGDYYWKGIPVHSPGGVRFKPLKLFLWIRILYYLLKFRKKQGIDIIHTFWLTDAALIGLIFGKFTGIPIISTAMGQDVKKQNRYLGLIRLFKPVMITISAFQSNLLKMNGNVAPMQVIPFGTDHSYFREKGQFRNIDILGVGNLNQTKNWRHFIEIIRQVAEIYPEIDCGIIGEGSQRQQLEQQIESSGLINRIRLYGRMEYDMVIQKMEESRILLHTSVFEGQGLVLTEAMAAGAYAVCYPVGIAWDLKSDKLRTGTTPEELVHHVLEVLSIEFPDHSPVNFWSIEETCKEYVESYYNLSVND
jgi:glycosyltransferase involved in cell wall biosynthesis